MTDPNVSTFLADRFVAIGKYQQACADRDELAAQIRELMIAMRSAIERRNAAEAMLTRLKFQRQENGVWTNIEL